MAKEEAGDNEYLMGDIERVILDLDSQKQKLQGLLQSLKGKNEGGETATASDTQDRGTIHKLISQEKEDSGKRIRNYASSLEELKKQLQELKEASKEEENSGGEKQEEDENNTEVASVALDEPTIENVSAKQKQLHRRLISDNPRALAHSTLLYQSEIRPQTMYVTSTDRIRPKVRVQKAVPPSNPVAASACSSKKKEVVKRPHVEKYETRPQTCDACCIV